jgi:hypothetical protein
MNPRFDSRSPNLVLQSGRQSGAQTRGVYKLHASQLSLLPHNPDQHRPVV